MDFILKRDLSDSNLIYVNLIKAKGLNELRKKISRTKELVLVEGSSELINRAAVEDKRVDVLLTPSKASKETRKTNSGLNQVLCKIANRNKVAIGFSFREVLISNNKQNLLSKMMQNVKLCRKYKINMVLGSFAKEENEIRDKRELASFGKVIGMNTLEIKKALNFKKKEKEIRLVKK